MGSEFPSHASVHAHSIQVARITKNDAVLVNGWKPQHTGLLNAVGGSNKEYSDEKNPEDFCFHLNSSIE